MSADWYTCSRCGAQMGIAGTSTGSDDDYATDDYFESEVERHESGECTPAVTVNPTRDEVLGLFEAAKARTLGGSMGTVSIEGSLFPPGWQPAPDPPARVVPRVERLGEWSASVLIGIGMVVALLVAVTVLLVAFAGLTWVWSVIWS